jgi:hypothetical protein
MAKITKEIRKDETQVAKDIVDQSIEKLNKAADVYQAQKGDSKNKRKGGK